MNEIVLKIIDLSFSYGETNTNILNNISLEFEENTITGILGCNGCGKSTLLNCIMGFNAGYKGKILLYKNNIKDYKLKEISKMITYLPQTIDNTYDYKVIDFLLFGRSPYLSVTSVPNREDYQKTHMYAEKTGVKDLLNKELNQLSGGEKKLVYITRTLIQEAEIILMDEPTAWLDFGNQYKILELIRDLRKEGKTVIFTIHNPNQLIEFNFNVVVINSSHITANGLAKNAISEEIIKQIYGERFVIKNDICVYNEYTLGKK